MSLELLLGPQLDAVVEAGGEVIGISAPGPYVAGAGTPRRPARRPRGVDPRLEPARRRAGRRRPVAHPSPRAADRAAHPQPQARALRTRRRSARRRTDRRQHRPRPLRDRGRPVGAARHRLHTRGDRLTVLRRRAGPERRGRRDDASLPSRPAVEGHPPRQRRRPAAVPSRPTVAAERAADAASVKWGADDDTVVVGCVGRLVAEKGYPELFEAVARSRTGCGWSSSAGTTPTSPMPSTPTWSAGSATAGVVFLGHRGDVADLLAAFDVFVLASHREGQPRAAMEAAASGLPVVATDIRGCRQVVDDGATGLLVPVRDAGGLRDALPSWPPRRTCAAACGTRPWPRPAASSTSAESSAPSCRPTRRWQHVRASHLVPHLSAR